MANKATSFAETQRWDREQHWALTPEERLAIARDLRERAYGKDAPDVREVERSAHRAFRIAPSQSDQPPDPS